MKKQFQKAMYMLQCTAYLVTFHSAKAQNVSINVTGNTAHASALLDVDAAPANNTGFLLPRIPLQAVNLAAPVTSPATSLLVYNTAAAGSGTNAVTPGFYYWDGTKWLRLANGLTAADVQTLSITGGTISIANGNSITLPPSTDAQTLSITGNTVAISNGNNITLPTFTEVDGSITNEIQALSISGSTIALSNGGGNVVIPASTGIQTLSITGNTVGISGGNTITLPAEVDGSITNEIQALSISGSTVSLSNGGGSVTLPAEVDGSITNEIQALSISGNTLSLSNGGGSVTIPNNNWSLTGNAGTTAGTNFVGTTDAKDVVFKSNALEAVRITTAGNVGIGTISPSTKLHVVSSTSNTAFRMQDGTEGLGKILVSDANGNASWANSGGPVVINSSAGSVTSLEPPSFYYTGANASVTVSGYYLITFRILCDKTPIGCGNYLAYNLATSSSSPTGLVVPFQDIHAASSYSVYDFGYTTTIAYLNAGNTYHLWIRYGGGCSSINTRGSFAENSFSLSLLK